MNTVAWEGVERRRARREYENARLELLAAIRCYKRGCHARRVEGDILCKAHKKEMHELFVKYNGDINEIDKRFWKG